MLSEAGLWALFRRLLLGCVVEAFLTSEVDVDIRTLELHFDPESVFHVPRLDNYMRFVGHVRGHLRGEWNDTTQARLMLNLRKVWPEIVSCLEIPIGGRMVVVRHDITILVHGDRMEIRFDLKAD